MSGTPIAPMDLTTFPPLKSALFDNLNKASLTGLQDGNTIKMAPWDSTKLYQPSIPNPNMGGFPMGNGKLKMETPPPRMVLSDDEGKVGKVWFEDGKFQFSGDVGKSARALFDELMILNTEHLLLNGKA